VRNLIRRESLALLAIILDLRSELRVHRSEKIKRALASIRKLISHTRLLGVSGHVSTQNVHVLIGALDELGMLLSSAQRSALSEDIVMTREGLVPRVHEAGRTRGDEHERVSRGRAERRAERAPRAQSSAIKDNNRTAQSEDRSDRILEVLRSGGTLGIKDIATNLPEYSEKMIQRELAVLVSDGRVRKVGAKRWSRYEIVQ
jgi:hypothetical protein